MTHPRDEHLFVIFGGTGDLAKRKLLPALARRMIAGDLPAGCVVLGISRRKWTDAEYRTFVRETLHTAGIVSESIIRQLEQRVYYHSIGQGLREDFYRLGQRMHELETAHRLKGNRVLYLALPPDAVHTTINRIGEAELHRSSGWTRVVIEKPFGRDLASARQLNQTLHQWFDESQIFRIDHYLGKETVQNLIAFRFANAVFESLWNRDRIDFITITVAEDIGIAHCAGYFDRVGTLRDMVQNHLMQLLTLIAMEVPIAFTARDLRYEKVKVLQAIAPITPERVVYGQYTAGNVHGRSVPAYRDEPGIPADSNTETFVAARLEIANWRWQGVPFYIRTGKRLPRRVTQIVVHFRCPPVSIFQPSVHCKIRPNILVMNLQPDEGFALGFQVKRPGPGFQLDTVRFEYRYADTFGPLPDAYETLLLDVIEGDPTLFVSEAEVERAWALWAPLLEQSVPVYPYPAGTWGPAEADRILVQDHIWVNINT